MDELITWLRAQLDDDERAARAATVLPGGAAEWFTGAEGSVLAADPSQLHVRGAVLSLDDIGVHIARWDPARVLAEVEAKRRILDDFSWEAGQVRAIQLLAQPYAGRDGWREEWRV